MNFYEQLFSLPPDVLYGLFIYIGAVVRSGQGKKVPIAAGMLTALPPAFVCFCVLVLLHYAITQMGYAPPVRVLTAIGGLLGFLGNKVVAGVEHQGKRLEDGSAVDFLIEMLQKFKSKP